MGNLCCCFKRDKKNELNNHLITNIYCDKCKKTYLSNYEYNKHIVRCNLIYGDL
jgi:hypothetical protein